VRSEEVGRAYIRGVVRRRTYTNAKCEREARVCVRGKGGATRVYLAAVTHCVDGAATVKVYKISLHP
jgi:hypothetical protein